MTVTPDLTVLLTFNQDLTLELLAHLSLSIDLQVLHRSTYLKLVLVIQEPSVVIQEPYSISVNKRHKFPQINLFNCQHSVFHIQRYVLPLPSSKYLFSPSFPNQACWTQDNFLLTCQHHLLSTLNLRHLFATQLVCDTDPPPTLFGYNDHSEETNEAEHGSYYLPPTFLFNSMLTSHPPLHDLTYKNTVFNSSCPQINKLKRE